MPSHKTREPHSIETNGTWRSWASETLHSTQAANGSTMSITMLNAVPRPTLGSRRDARDHEQRVARHAVEALDRLSLLECGVRLFRERLVPLQ
jgi:hypothetical protein